MSLPAREPAPRRGVFWASPPSLLAHGLLLIALLAPIVATGGLFLFDLPNHVFRMHLIADLLSGGESSFYAFDLRPIPNLPLDLATIALRRVLDPAHIATLVTCMAAAGFYLSIVYWRAVSGRSTSLWTCLVVVLVLYSFPLYVGLINYVLGLAVMNVALARLDRHGERLSPWLWFSQCLLVVVTYFCSAFPVLLYFVWVGGTALYDVLRRRAGWPALIWRNAVLHLPPIAIVLALIAFADPEPPGESGTFWAAAQKIEAILAIGRMSNLPHEFLFGPLILLAIGLRYAAGGLSFDRRNAAGLAALALCFLAIPTTLKNVALVDVRLSMGVVGVLLAVAKETRDARHLRLNAAAAYLVGFLVLARALSLPAAWLPLTWMKGAYEELAQKVEDRSTVLFVLDGLTSGQRTAKVLNGWTSALRTGKLPTRDNPIAYATVYHIYMDAFRGRDVLLSSTFLNFAVRQKADLPFRPLHGILLTRPKLAEILAAEPHHYVLAHIALDDLAISGKRLCLAAERDGIRLYRVVAGDACPSGGNAGPP